MMPSGARRVPGPRRSGAVGQWPTVGQPVTETTVVATVEPPISWVTVPR